MYSPIYWYAIYLKVTKKEAKCSTPPSKSNALLSNLMELSCESSEEIEEVPLKDIRPEEPSDITLQQQISEEGFVNLTWAIRLNKFMCQNLQVNIFFIHTKWILIS